MYSDLKLGESYRLLGWLRPQLLSQPLTEVGGQRAGPPARRDKPLESLQDSGSIRCVLYGGRDGWVGSKAESHDC